MYACGEKYDLEHPIRLMVNMDDVSPEQTEKISTVDPTRPGSSPLSLFWHTAHTPDLFLQVRETRL